MRNNGLALLTATMIAAAPSPVAAGRHGWAHASSAGRNLLVVASLGVPAVQGDWRGDLQAAGSLAAAGGATYLLK
ncbi:MAG: phosphatase PAP2 family protein, partial [Alphaproteobacteria bacterium]